MRKPKILLSSDSPNMFTGFGRLARELITRLEKDYDIDVLSPYTSTNFSKFGKNTSVYSINYQNGHSLPRQAEELLRSGGYDMYWVIGPLEVVGSYCNWFEQRHLGLPPMIAYIPIEQDYLNGFQVLDLEYCKKIVTYHEFARDAFAKMGTHKVGNIPVIEHGVDLKNFHPLENREELREKGLVKLNKDSHLIVTVGTNQWRKNPFPAIAGVMLFANDHPELDIRYYLHTPRGGHAGHLPRMVESAKYYLEYATKREMKMDCIRLNAVEDPYLSDEKMNELYNCADAVLSTNIAEGWGFMVTEAMASKTLVISPLHTSHRYLMGSNSERGVAIDVDNLEMCTSYGFNEVARHTISVRNVYKALEEAFLGDRQVIETKIEEAYEFVHKDLYNWNNIAKKWKKVIDDTLKGRY